MSTLRVVLSKALPRASALRAASSVTPRIVTPAAQWKRYGSRKVPESDEQFDARWENYFNRDGIDAWELRKGMNELYGHDLVPEPKIVEAMLKAARRLNDVAIAIRILEMVKSKAAGDQQIYSHIMDAVKPTLEELGLNTPEVLGLA